MELSSSGSSKRPRAPSNQTQLPSCMVDGCTADLSKCRDYHRRHKVCEFHSKFPRVMIQGHEMRFCQQCSRFHSLVEFDEGKRSCRKRLDGHNRRRRKPQPGSLPMNSGELLSNHRGTGYLPFSNPNIFPSTEMASPAWTATINAVELNFAEGKTLFLGSTSEDYNKGGKQFQFLQETCPVSQQLVTGSDSSPGLSRIFDSSSALSLLSSQAGGTQEILAAPSQIAQPDLFQTDAAYNTLLGSGACNSGSNTNLQEQGFCIGNESDDGSSLVGSNQRLSFSWEYSN